jgi:uncharacterized protein DUF6454
MRRFIALLHIVFVTAAAPQQHDTLTLTRTTALAGETFHVQGIEVDGSTLWVTSVDTKAKRGLLFEYRLPEGRLVRSVEIHDGERYHPGGLMASGDSLWIPVAEYRRASTAVIQRRNKRTLALEGHFLVDDHIGAIAVTPEGLVGANWDARDLYVWDRNGNLSRKVANSSGIAIQDMKFDGNRLIGGGLRPDKSGEIVWMKWPSLEIEKRLPVGRTDRDVVYTHEGIAIRGDKLWFLPEDGPSRLFEFRMQ